MARSIPSVADYMTEDRSAVSAHEPVARARELMRERQVRHLPVMRNGDLVGIVSERDITLARTLSGSRLEHVPIEMIMCHRPYAVPPDAPLNHVARVMADRRHGAAVILDRGRLVGVLTATNALLALADVLEGKHARTWDRITD